MNAIDLVALTKVYRKKHLFSTTATVGLEQVTLSVAPGELFGLLGLNGSGKTTTIKLILGLLRPTAGSVGVLGASVPSKDISRRVGYLPEVPYFYRYLTAREVLTMYASLSGVPETGSAVERMLDMVGLRPAADRKLAEFSKGMLQRIGIAQSLVHDPDILIYDEPVSGLDPLAMKEMRLLLLSLKERGKTIFLSSHLISEVERVCDRVAVLSRGRLVRVLEQREWAGAAGELERIFVADVADAADGGRLKLS